jgi:hypothetical protein
MCQCEAAAAAAAIWPCLTPRSASRHWRLASDSYELMSCVCVDL